VRPGDGPDFDKLMADLLITDSEAIFAIKQGLREVSLGYDAQYVEDAPGRGHQTSIIGNHVALVPMGRCGPQCAIKDQTNIKEIGMTKLQQLKEQFRGFFSAFDAAVEEIDPEKKTADAETEKEKETGDGDGKAPDLTEVIDSLRGQLDACGAEVKKYADKIAAIEDAIARLTAKDEEPEKKETGDAAPAMPDAETIARAEILAPGIEPAADMPQVALKAAYATTDGKAIIDTLSCGKAPAFDSLDLFVAAAELMRAQRKDRLAETKTKTKDAPTVDHYQQFAKRAAEVFPVPKL